MNRAASCLVAGALATSPLAALAQPLDATEQGSPDVPATASPNDPDVPATAEREASGPPKPKTLSGEPSWSIPALHATGLFVTLRLSEAYLYPDPFAETRWSVVGEHYREAFTRPPKFDASRPAFEWDGDPWHINVVGHALMGSELYLRARTCGHGPLQSLAFTAASGVVWDYAFEGNGVRPSALDMVYTPLSGIALGELRYFVVRSSNRLETPLLRGVVRGLFDPFGELERWAGTRC